MELFCGDCLEVMKSIPDGSVDMILCDLPYGTTACKWDTVIPFVPLWEQYKRVIKSNGAIVLFGSEPFSSALRMSNLKMYKYDWIWEKSKASGFLDSKKKPLANYENVIVFYARQPIYNAQMIKGKKHNNCSPSKQAEIYNNMTKRTQTVSEYYFPKRILFFNSVGRTQHPTQKPVSLLEYLIKTYTLEGETVLDNTMGSGSTGVACVNTGRNFIGIELDDEYFEIAKNRIADAMQRKESQHDLIPDAEIFREPDPTLF